MSIEANKTHLSADEIGVLITHNKSMMDLHGADKNYVKAAKHQNRVAELEAMRTPSGVRGP